MELSKEIPKKEALAVGMVFINDRTETMVTIEDINHDRGSLKFRRNKDSHLVLRPIALFYNAMVTKEWSYVLSMGQKVEVSFSICRHVNVVTENYFSGNKYKWCKDCKAALK